jgi:outer membrane receptor for ferrienterochelin and colicins
MRNVNYVACLILLIVLSASSSLHAQTITGKVLQREDSGNWLALPGANVFWIDGSEAVQTDLKGNFKIEKNGATTLLIQFIGFKTDTIDVSGLKTLEIKLMRDNELSIVEIEARQGATTISRLDPIKTEVLSSAELGKAACCNLSESFETNNSVDAVATDAITGTRQIQMLGLSGIYTQTLRENLPQMRGLLANAGFGQVPGTWIESIQISKGVGSVVNGFESIAGQINIEYKKPTSKERMQFNGYVNHMGRNELNLVKTIRLNNKWQTTLLTHADYMKRDWDRNKDGFMDNPDGKQWNVENRWKYISHKNIEAQFGVHALQDERESGTLHQNDGEVHEHDWQYIGKTTRADAFAKIGYVFTGKPYKSFGFLGNAFYVKDNVVLGPTQYQAEQQSAYASMIYQSQIGSDVHSFKTGFNIQYDNFDEYLSANSAFFKRIETVAGGFFEYTLKTGRTTVVAGLRADHNTIFGNFITPRLHYKFMLTESTALRLSGGRGQRTANVISENLGYFASSRQLNIIQSYNNSASGYGLLPEIGWNGGGGITHSYTLMGNEGSISGDAFYTYFEHQTVVDLDASTKQIVIYNLEGNSFAFSGQVDWNQELGKRFDIRLSYKYTNTETKYLTGNLARPFVAPHRGLFNLAYHSRQDKWVGDVTVNYVSSKRLPDSRSNPIEFQSRAYSPNYAVLNMQLTRNLKNWAVYVGAENLLDIQQQQQIISPSDPHSPYFDASYIWGPTFGRVFYLGFRWVISEE